MCFTARLFKRGEVALVPAQEQLIPQSKMSGNSQHSCDPSTEEARSIDKTTPVSEVTSRKRTHQDETTQSPSPKRRATALQRASPQGPPAVVQASSSSEALAGCPSLSSTPLLHATTSVSPAKCKRWKGKELVGKRPVLRRSSSESHEKAPAVVSSEVVSRKRTRDVDSLESPSGKRQVTERKPNVSLKPETSRQTTQEDDIFEINKKLESLNCQYRIKHKIGEGKLWISGVRVSLLKSYFFFLGTFSTVYRAENIQQKKKEGEDGGE